MKIYKKNNASGYRNLIISVLCFAAIILVFVFTLTNASKNVEEKSKENMMNAINKALVTCYSVEGFYPTSIEYLEEHYGVIIDRENYIVNFPAMIGDNIRPQVTLEKKG